MPCAATCTPIYLAVSPMKSHYIIVHNHNHNLTMEGNYTQFASLPFPIQLCYLLFPSHCRNTQTYIVCPPCSKAKNQKPKKKPALPRRGEAPPQPAHHVSRETSYIAVFPLSSKGTNQSYEANTCSGERRGVLSFTFSQINEKKRLKPEDAVFVCGMVVVFVVVAVVGPCSALPCS